MNRSDMQIIKLALAFGAANLALVVLGLWKLGELIAGVI